MKLNSFVINELRKDTYTPNNDNFSSDALYSLLYSNSDNHDDTLKIFFDFIVYINNIYNHISVALKSYIINSNIHRDDIVMNFITLLNEIYERFNNEIDQKQNKTNFHNFTNILDLKRDNEDGNEIIYQADIQMDSMLDSAQIILNTTTNHHVKTSRDATGTDFSYIDQFHKMIVSQQYLLILLELYNKILYSNINIRTSSTSNLHLDLSANNNLKYFLIGRHRFNEHTFNLSMFFANDLKKANTVDIIYSQNNIDSHYTISSVILEDDCIKYRLDKRRDGYALQLFNQTLAETMAFYEYALFTELSINNSKVSIITILHIYAELNNLSRLVREKVSEVTSQNSNSHYTMKYSYLISLLKTKTNYSYALLKDVLSLFISDTNKFDFFFKPLTLIDQKVNFLHYPIENMLTVRSIDSWLNKGGYNLSARGKLFERHVKSFLKDDLESNVKPLKIYDTNNFKGKKGKEEIDLLVEYDNFILIGELTCTKYPVSYKDFNDVERRLKRKIGSLKRKLSFMKSNRFDIKPKISKNKKIIPIVITNYPHFSGIEFNDIPIVDLLLLNNYLITGKYSRAEVKKTSTGVISDTVNEHIYYKDSASMGKNISGFLKNPFPIKYLMSRLCLQEHKIPLYNIPFDVYDQDYYLKDNLTHDF